MCKTVCTVLLLGIAAVTLPTLACSGAAGGFFQKSIAAYSDYSGFIASDGFVGTGLDLAIGDNNGDFWATGFYSFMLNSIPAGSSVVSATIRTYQHSITGTPYADLSGTITGYCVDLGNVGFDAGDLNAYMTGTQVGVLSSSNAVGPRTLDVTGAVQAAVAAGQPRIDFQFLFTMMTDGNGDDDFATFTDWQNALGSPAAPDLLVEYEN